MTKLFRVLRSPAFIVAVALAVRLGAIFYQRTYLLPPVRDHLFFGFEMGRIARSIATGQGLSSPYDAPTGPTAVAGPIYPYLLAGVFKLFGIYTDKSAIVILSLDSLFSALTCLTAFLIGREIFGPSVGVWAGWVWAFFPYAIWFAAHLIWETNLSAFLLSLIFLLTLRLESSTNPWEWVGFGLLWGLTTLVNTTLVLFFPISLGWLYFRRRRLGLQSARPAGAVVFALIASVVPWLAHNYIVFDRFVFRDNFALELYQGNREGATSLIEHRYHPLRDPAEMAEYRRSGELAYMARKRNQAIQYIVDHPWSFAARSAGRWVAYYWTGTKDPLLNNCLVGRYRRQKVLLYMLVAALSTIGILIAHHDRKTEASLFAALLLVFPAPYFITHVHARFRHTLEPEMVVLGVYAVMKVLSALAHKLSPKHAKSECPAPIAVPS